MRLNPAGKLTLEGLLALLALVAEELLNALIDDPSRESDGRRRVASFERVLRGGQHAMVSIIGTVVAATVQTHSVGVVRPLYTTKEVSN